MKPIREDLVDGCALCPIRRMEVCRDAGQLPPVAIFHIGVPSLLEQPECTGCTGDGERFDAKFDYNEFRTLYEVLKSRDSKKIQSKYGTANFKEMVGEKNEDQFALMATETIMAEINKLVQERETEAKRLEDEHRRISNELWEKQKKEKEDSKNFYNEKIKELEDQIKAMRNGFQFTL